MGLVLGCMSRSAAHWLKGVFPSTYLATPRLPRPISRPSPPAQSKKDNDKLERITGLVRGLGCMRELCLLNLRRRRFKLESNHHLPPSNEDYKDNGVRCFSEVKNKKERGNRCKLQQGKCQPVLRKKFFMVRLEWLHGGALGSPVLEVCKTQLDKTLSYLSPGLRLDDLQRSFTT